MHARAHILLRLRVQTSFLHRNGKGAGVNRHRERDVNQFKYIDGVTYVTDDYCQDAMKNERRNAFWVGFIGGLFAMACVATMWPR